MRNYIILNGQNSNEITGLLIQSLPPISQPKIRTNIEEIDGRDGDIITKLGYSAYNKEISIGLYGNYDVDDIIKYFTDNQSGKVTFSDEPDKYYNYEILEQIDFERLIRYKTADVKLHCQPFKYSTTEEKIQINATEVSGSGSNITLDNTEDGAIFTSLKINGDTSQDTTTGKNLLPNDLATKTINGITITKNNDGTYKVNGTATSDVSEAICNNFISMSGTWRMLGCPSGGSSSTYMLSAYVDYWGAGSPNIDTGSGTNITYTGNVKVRFYIKSGTTCNNLIFKPMLTTDTSTTINNWEPYTYGASPNPDYPQDVDVVTGDNTINIVGKNLLDVSTTIIGRAWNNATNSARAVVYAKVQPNTTYTLSVQDITNVDAVNYFEKVNDTDNTTIGGLIELTTTRTITTSSTTNYIGVQVNKTAISLSDVEGIDLQIEIGNHASNFEPYVSQTYSVDLGLIELCKIGDYQDYIYKENGNWYLYKAIGKAVLDGSENWQYSAQTNSVFYVQNLITDFARSNNIPLSNYYVGKTNVGNTSGASNNGNNTISFNNYSSTNYLYVVNNTYTSANDFKTWLSTHNTIVYYQLATPITTQITDETLLSQLEALAGATTYLGQTNIITSGSTLNPLLDVTTYAVDDPSFVITNSGNFKSKPIITIYGLGTIGLYLNGIQVLSLDMGETTSQITIDVAKLEAYNQETGALMNRSVTGDYNNLSLNVGENTITESGTLQGIEIENYSRWL